MKDSFLVPFFRLATCGLPRAMYYCPKEEASPRRVALRNSFSVKGYTELLKCILEEKSKRPPAKPRQNIMFQPDGGKEGKHFLGRKSVLPSPSEKKETTHAKTQHNKGPTEKPAAKSFNSTRKKQHFPLFVSDPPAKKVPSQTEPPTSRRSPGKRTDTKTVPSAERSGVHTTRELPATVVLVRETRASRLRAATKLPAAEPPPGLSLSAPSLPPPPPKLPTPSNKPLAFNDSPRPRNPFLNRCQAPETANDDSAAQDSLKVWRDPLRSNRLELSSRRSQSRRDKECLSENVIQKASRVGVGRRTNQERSKSVEGGSDLRDQESIPKGNFCREKMSSKDTIIGKKSVDSAAPGAETRDMKKREAIEPINSVVDLKGGRTDSRKLEGKRAVPIFGEGHSGNETDSGLLVEIGPLKASILKTRFTGTPILYEQKPVSILKRKCLSQQDTQTGSLVFPVTFAPSTLKGPRDSIKKQGILKKRRSLDENEVRRERARSPDAKPILKTQRRSSMEELTRRTHSPDPTVPHGILKRKCSKEEEEEPSSGEPQGILKRKHSVQLPSVTTLPATQGPPGQDTCPTPDAVRPILKKKPSEEHPLSDTTLSDAPKSILKKKTTSDNDDTEGKPKKTILKTSKTPSAEDPEEATHSPEPIRPILKKEHSGKPVDPNDSESSCPCLKCRKHTLSDAKGPPIAPTTCRLMGPSPNPTTPKIDQTPSTDLADDLHNSCSGSLRPEPSSDESPSLCSGVLSSFTRKSECKASRQENDCQLFSSAFEPGSSEKLYYHDQKRQHVDLIVQTHCSTSHTHASLHPCQEHITDLTLKPPHQKINMDNPEALEAPEESPDVPEQKMGPTEYNPLTERCVENCLPPQSVKRLITQPVSLQEIQLAVHGTSTSAPPSTAAPRTNKATSYLSKSTSRITRSKSSIALQLEALLGKSNRDQIFKNLNSIRSQLEALPREADLTASPPITTNEDHNKTRPLQPAAEGPPEYPLTPVKMSVSPRSNSSIVKSQSHSGIAPGLHSSHAKSSTDEGHDEGGEGAEGTPRRQSDGGCALQRTRTHHCPSPDVSSADDDMTGASIQERLARLKKNGELAWQRRRCLMTDVEGELSVLSASGNPLLKESTFLKDLSSPTSTSRPVENPGPKGCTSLADRLNKLDAAQSGWKKRVQPSDALRFTVEGKTPPRNALDLPLPVTGLPRQKRSPKPFKYTKKHLKETCSATEEPKTAANSEDSRRSVGKPSTGPVVAVPVPKNDDETFTSFFNGVSGGSHAGDLLEINDEDLDALSHIQSSQLLVLRKDIKRQRRRAAIRNPVRSLASRLESQEYTEVRTAVTQRDLRRMKLEKGEKVSQLAVEALAGLASEEDFTAVSLKRVEGRVAFADAPYKEPMLLQVKGRRHVQTRLVEPVASSVNAGDCFVLVTKDKVFHYIGRLANVIERSRGAEICLHIQQTGDLGCGAEGVITIGETGRATAKEMEEFWNILGGKPGCERGAGAPDEDEIFEKCLIDTNMVYEVIDDELVPDERFWGSTPKMDILDPNKVLVFDFGSEFYVWNGKGVDLSKRKTALELARKLWDEGFDYSDCALCPLTAASVAGSSESPGKEASGAKVAASRPPWALFAKITQNMETVLFREKFLDWPDYSRVIRKEKRGEEEDEEQGEEAVDGEGVLCSELKPCDPASMIENVVPRPDLVLEGSHLGRGVRHFDEETRRCSEIATRNVTVWHISEYEYTEVPECSLGQFHMEDSYVVRWYYTVTAVGRELGGQPSKHLTAGRDRYAYFCWQGQDSPINDKGAAACLTVELDKENGPQIRVAQGFEPPAFLNMFDGKMVVHRGSRSSTDSLDEWRFFVSRGGTESESVLFEVLCTGQSLRSAASFVLVNRLRGIIIVWHGSQSQLHQRRVALAAARRIQSLRPREFCFTAPDVTLAEETEGDESKEFQVTLGSDPGLYCSSLGQDQASGVATPRLFYLSSISGDFNWTEVVSPYLGEEAPTPFPFLQADLYSVSQPALFLLEAGAELWLWQGWEEAGSDSGTGSGSLRFQAERRAAMATAIAYWHHRKGGGASGEEPRLVWAGLEPLAFTNRFPIWTERKDVAAMNIKDGRRAGEAVPVGTELERLTRSFYSLSELQSRPLPEGVNPNLLEDYLRAEYFQELFGLSREEFLKMPSWKKKKLKQEAGLF